MSEVTLYVGLADFSQVDTLVSCYKPVNCGGQKQPRPLERKIALTVGAKNSPHIVSFSVPTEADRVCGCLGDDQIALHEKRQS